MGVALSIFAAYLLGLVTSASLAIVGLGNRLIIVAIGVASLTLAATINFYTRPLPQRQEAES